MGDSRRGPWLFEGGSAARPTAAVRRRAGRIMDNHVEIGNRPHNHKTTIQIPRSRSWVNGCANLCTNWASGTSIQRNKHKETQYRLYWPSCFVRCHAHAQKTTQRSKPRPVPVVWGGLLLHAHTHAHTNAHTRSIISRTDPAQALETLWKSTP